MLQIKQGHSRLFVSLLLLLTKLGLGGLVLRLLRETSLVPEETRGSKLLLLIEAQALMLCQGVTAIRWQQQLPCLFFPSYVSFSCSASPRSLDFIIPFSFSAGLSVPFCLSLLLSLSVCCCVVAPLSPSVPACCCLFQSPPAFLPFRVFAHQCL